MNIDGKADFAGSAMLAVRDTVRSLHHLADLFDQETYEEVFAGTPGTEGVVLSKLLEEGYLEAASAEKLAKHVHRLDRDKPHFLLTVKGGALALASAGKPIRRATANRVLKGFLHRVLEIEDDELYLDVLAEVALFGSMLDPDRDPVSDVDLALRIERHEERFAAVSREVPLALFYRDLGQRRVDPEEIPYKNETDIKRYLKSRKTSLSLHQIDEDGAIAGVPGIEHRILYRRGEGLIPSEWS